MPDIITHELMAPVFLHSFFYLQITSSTWFSLKHTLQILFSSFLKIAVTPKLFRICFIYSKCV